MRNKIWLLAPTSRWSYRGAPRERGDDTENVPTLAASRRAVLNRTPAKTRTNGLLKLGLVPARPRLQARARLSSGGRLGGGA